MTFDVRRAQKSARRGNIKFNSTNSINPTNKVDAPRDARPVITFANARGSPFRYSFSHSLLFVPLPPSSSLLFLFTVSDNRHAIRWAVKHLRSLFPLA